MASYHVGVDIGGTFTDAVLQDTESGRLWAAKVPSTPEDHSVGYVRAVAKALSMAGARASDVGRMFHGTTIATNAVIERTPTKIGLLTTWGFKYVLDIGRHDIPRRQNIYGWLRPPRPVSPDLIFEVPERLDREGRVLVPLDEDTAREAARRLRSLGVGSIAVCLLYSYANPAHERRIAEILGEEHPQALVSLSSEVLPQFREFERSVATVLNAYVRPHVGRYLSALTRAAASGGLHAPLFVMKSNGGVTTASTASRQAIHTVLSGPVAGVMGAVEIARAAGHPSFVSIDVGGTSADISLVKDGVPDVTLERSIGGLPLQLPMLDIVTIGAGGGSIAQPTATGGLAVGPQSAGAAPGPACYSQGGTDATVTDAHLLLGRLPPSLLGGEMPLDREAARRAIEAMVARPLGLDVMDAAAGVVAIANNNMAGAIRAVSVGRGHDPQRFALVAFGGSGPLHACPLATLLGIQTIVVPPTPGVLSTYGLLFTDLKNDHVQTYVAPASTLDLALVADAYSRLEREARAWLEHEGVGPRDRRLVRSADLRYAHQGFEITVEVPSGPIGQETMRQVSERFHQLHDRLYTYHLPQAVVELVNMRVTAIGTLPKHPMAPIGEGDGRRPQPVSGRPVSFFRGEGFVETPVYRRADLRAGMTLEGPAVVEQMDTTTLVWPGYRAAVDARGNLVLTRHA